VVFEEASSRPHLPGDGTWKKTTETRIFFLTQSDVKNYDVNLFLHVKKYYVNLQG